MWPTASPSHVCECEAIKHIVVKSVHNCKEYVVISPHLWLMLLMCVNQSFIQSAIKPTVSHLLSPASHVFRSL